jgi:solute:Na+ symporter, SSS family
MGIAQVFNWIMMVLGGGVIMPNLLRWYWWRMNGWGYALGSLTCMMLSQVAFFFPEAPVYYIFLVISAISLLVCIVGSMVTRLVAREVLVDFHCSVRPFGLWGPIRAEANLSPQEQQTRSARAPLAILNVVLGMIAIGGLYLFPMYSDVRD